jgi:hypothetical protein
VNLLRGISADDFLRQHDGAESHRLVDAAFDVPLVDVVADLAKYNISAVPVYREEVVALPGLAGAGTIACRVVRCALVMLSQCDADGLRTWMLTCAVSRA